MFIAPPQLGNLSQAMENYLSTTPCHHDNDRKPPLAVYLIITYQTHHIHLTALKVPISQVAIWPALLRSETLT